MRKELRNGRTWTDSLGWANVAGGSSVQIASVEDLATADRVRVGVETRLSVGAAFDLLVGNHLVVWVIFSGNSVGQETLDVLNAQIFSSSQLLQSIPDFWLLIAVGSSFLDLKISETNFIGFMVWFL